MPQPISDILARAYKDGCYDREHSFPCSPQDNGWHSIEGCKAYYKGYFLTSKLVQLELFSV